MQTLEHTPKLPHIVDALKLCQQKAKVNGFIRFTALPRLMTVLSDTEGHVQVDIEFDVDEQHRKVLIGGAEAVLSLTCQRCLDTMTWPLKTEFNLALVWDEEQIAQLPRSLDPVLVEESDIDLYRVVEDEILLALPLVSHHEVGMCVAPVMDNPVAGVDVKEEKKNPFQALASLKAAGQPGKESGE